MEAARRATSRRFVTLLLATFALVAGLGVVSSAPAQATLYPSGCWTTAVGGSQANHKKWCWIGSNSSKYDKRSNMTVMAQRILKLDGWYSGAIDGDFGSITANAVRNYQANRGLVQDGVVGGNTWVKLMYTSILDCGILYHGTHQTFAYRIAGEGCGRYLQQAGNFYWAVRSYASNGTNVYDNTYVTATTNGPTALTLAAPTVESNSVEERTLELDGAELAEATELGQAADLTLQRAERIIDPVTGETQMTDAVYADTSGAPVNRTVSMTDQAGADLNFENLLSYPDEFGYAPIVTDVGAGYARTLPGINHHLVVFDAEAGELISVSVDVEASHATLSQDLVDRTLDLL